jgi:hypothetical protein
MQKGRSTTGKMPVLFFTGVSDAGYGCLVIPYPGKGLCRLRDEAVGGLVPS